MKMFKIINSKIRYKLIFGFVFISLFVGVVSYIGISTIRHIESRYTHISISQPLVQSLEDMKFACLRLISSASEYAYIQTESKNKSEGSALEQESYLIHQSCNSCHKAFFQYVHLVKTSFPELAENSNEIRNCGNKVHIAALEFIEMKKQKISGTEPLEKKEEMEVNEMSFLKAVNHTIEHTNDRLEKERAPLEYTISSSLRNIIIFSGLTVFLSVLFGFLYSRSLSNSITKLTQQTENFRKGNLDAKIDIKSTDEIGALGRSFNEMAERIKLLVIELEDEINIVKRAEETLRESEDRYRDLVENSSDLISTHDLDGNFLSINNATINITGYSKDEVLSMNLQNIIAPEYQGLLNEYLDKIKATGEAHGLMIIKTKTGEKRIWEYNNTLRSDAVTKPIVRGMAKDVTERRHAELIIQQQNKQLQELNAAKDKFFSIIAHDLKSPFQGLLGLTEMMAGGNEKFSEDDLLNYGKSMHKSVSTLFQLIENLLEWAQMQKGSISFTPTELNLSALALQNIEIINQRAFQKGITISNEMPGSLQVVADEKMVNTVLRNLLSNAVKFTSRDGKIIIRSKKTEDEMVEVSVQDTGVGISEKDVKRLFKTEEKVSSKGTEGEPSTGLGLLLCKEFVEKQGGKIWVESEKGKGSTFYFTIPESSNKNN